MWFQRSDTLDALEEILAEEHEKNEWRIGQHPLLGLDEFIEDIFPLHTLSWEGKNYSQTSGSPLEISTFEVSVKLRTDAMIRSGPNLKQSNVLTSASNYDRPEQESPDTHLQHQVAAPIREDNNNQTIDFSHGASTSEASPGVRSDVNRRESHLRQPSIQTVASNCNRSEQVHIQNQPTTTNENISRSIGNPCDAAAQWRERECEFNRFTNFNALSSNAQEDNCTDERFSSGFPNFTAGVPEQGKQCSLSSSTITLLAQLKNLRTAQAPPETSYSCGQKAPCTNRPSTSQYAKSNARCNNLKAMGLSNREILRYHVEENWYGHKSEDMKTTQDSNENNSTVSKSPRKET